MSWENEIPKIKCMIYYGPPGVGKTTLALMIAHNTHKDVSHFNSSDLSTKDDLKRIVGISTMSTLNENNMRFIIIDECDRISKQNQKILVELINTTLQPIIFICNDISKISQEIKSKCIPIRFSMIPEIHIKKVLLKIIHSENIEISNTELEKILKYNKSMRGAINSLEDFMMSGEISEMTRDLDLSDVEKVSRMLLGQYNKSSMKLETANIWIANSEINDYNIPSQVDIVVNRIKTSQNYDLYDIGFDMLCQARGRLCKYPYQFIAMLQNKQKEINEDSSDEHISIGSSKKKKKKINDVIKFDDNNENKSAGLEEFI